MTGRTRRGGAADNPSVQLTIAALCLSLGVAWLVGLRPDGPMYWVFAIGSLIAAAVWLARAVRTLSTRRGTDRRDR